MTPYERAKMDPVERAKLQALERIATMLEYIFGAFLVLIFAVSCHAR